MNVFNCLCALALMTGAVFGQGQSDAHASAKAALQILKPDRVIANAGTIHPALLAYSPDGRWMAVANAKSIRIYEVHAGAASKIDLARTLTGHTAPIAGFAFSDTNTIVSIALDQTAKVWDVATGKMRHSAPMQFGKQIHFALAPAHSFLAADSSSGTVRLWNYQTGEILKTFAPGDSWASALAFTPDGKSLVIGTEKGVLRVMDVASWTVSRTIDLDSPIASLAASADRIVLGYSEGTVATLTFGDQSDVPEMKKQSGAINALAFSRNGELFASASADHTVLVWDSKTQKPLYSLQGHGASVLAVAFSSDGQKIVSIDATGALNFWTMPKR